MSVAAGASTRSLLGVSTRRPYGRPPQETVPPEAGTGQQVPIGELGEDRAVCRVAIGVDCKEGAFKRLALSEPNYELQKF